MTDEERAVLRRRIASAWLAVQKDYADEGHLPAEILPEMVGNMVSLCANVCRHNLELSALLFLDICIAAAKDEWGEE